jgi:MFS transporter, ACS family, tartrate transporter
LTGYLVAIPYAFGVIAMIWWTRHSDRTKERVWHVAPAILAGGSLIAAAYLSSPVLAGLALILCAMATYSALPTFWTVPTAFLTGSAAAGGIALINSIGNLGGFVGPYAIGWTEQPSPSRRGVISLSRFEIDHHRQFHPLALQCTFVSFRRLCFPS